METSGLSAFGLRMWMVVRIKTNRRFVRMSPRRRGAMHGGARFEEFEALRRTIEDLEHTRDGNVETYS